MTVDRCSSTYLDVPLLATVAGNIYIALNCTWKDLRNMIRSDLVEQLYTETDKVATSLDCWHVGSLESVSAVGSLRISLEPTSPTSCE